MVGVKGEMPLQQISELKNDHLVYTSFHLVKKKNRLVFSFRYI
jgi:hypothetical protein